MEPHGAWSPTVDRFATIQPQQFKRAVSELRDSIDEVVDAIGDQVENGKITPLQGLGMIGCVTAQTLSYGAFHGEATVVDLAQYLLPAAERERALSRS